jgi:hypothetical protein
LAKGLKSIQIPQGVSPRFLVKMENSNDADLNIINPVLIKFGQTLLHDNNATIRMISSVPAPEQQPYWMVTFDNDNVGVINATDYTDMKPVSYSNLWVVFFDGKKVTVPSTIDQKDFAGLQVDWKRTTPINQKDIHGVS